MPNYVYSDQERLRWVLDFASGLSARRVCEKFAQENPGRPTPHHVTILRTYNYFCVHGTVTQAHRKVKYPTRALSEEQRIQICASAEVDSRTSTSRISQQMHLAQSTVWKVLKEEKYFAYKLRVHQQLFAPDLVVRNNFCQEMLGRINADPGMLDNIVFADEATVQLYGAPNRQNVRSWSRENNHELREAKTQYPEKLNLYGAVCGGTLLGPYVIQGNLNGGMYLDLLQNRVGEALRNLQQNLCTEKHQYKDFKKIYELR